MSTILFSCSSAVGGPPIGVHHIYLLTQSGPSIILEACLGLHELWLPACVIMLPNAVIGGAERSSVTSYPYSISVPITRRQSPGSPQAERP